MNAIVNKLLSAGNEFMPEINLKQSIFKYSACGLFPKNKERIKKLQIQEIQDIFIRMNLIKLVFLLDMAYGRFKDLN